MRAVFVLVLSASACGSFLAADEDGSNSPNTPDASAGGGDGAAEAAQGSSDGGFLSDGGCSARFCCNFDAPDAACAWTDEFSDDAGFTFFGPSSIQANSKPSSLRALTDNSPFDNAEHTLRYTLASLVETTIHFNVRVDQNAGTSSIHPLEIRCDKKTLIVKLRRDQDRRLQIGGDAITSGADLTIAETYPTAQFFGIDIAIRIPAPGNALFIATSELAGSTAQSSDPAPCATPELRFGATVFGTGLYEIYVDDIVVE